MKLVEYKLEELINEVASSSPAPGGGSVSALAGANAAALVMMVSSLTVEKKKFKALETSTQNSYIETIKKFAIAKEDFMKYVDEDSASFNLVMSALKLPKSNEMEIELRNQEIQKATLASIMTPLRVSALALELLREMDLVIKHSNRNTVSDQGVAVLLLVSACKGALLNVKINLPSLSEKSLVKEHKDVIIVMENEVEDLQERLMEEVNYLLD